jgi:hypothetical protein
MFRRTFTFAVVAVVARAYQPSLTRSSLSNSYRTTSTRQQLEIETNSIRPVSEAFTKTVSKVAAAALSAVILATATTALPPPAFAISKNAATVTIDQFPPTSILVQDDLPLIGSLLSGTYQKVPDGTVVKKPSVVIKSPKDKVGATSDLFFNGHLEFDVDGKLSTHLNIDLAADEPGVAKLRISSNLIPSLPYHNGASNKGAALTSLGAQSKGKESAWYALTNLGSGDIYYKNFNTGAVSTKKPSNIY